MRPGESRNTIIKSLGVALAIVVLIYAYFETRNLIYGPQISINEPENGALVESPVVLIRGIAKNISKINLNGRPISIDEKGNFVEIIALQEGYNIVSLFGEDRFGKSKEVRLELVQKEGSSPDINNVNQNAEEN